MSQEQEISPNEARAMANKLGIDLNSRRPEYAKADAERKASQWTTDLPTEPGFWWMDDDAPGDPGVILIEQLENGRLCCCYAGELNTIAINASRFGWTHFAGPLVPPEMK